MYTINNYDNYSNKSLIILIFSLLIIFIFLYCGSFAIPSADDYAYANVIKEKNFWDSQVDIYKGWSGRYTATFLITLFGKFSLQKYWLVPWLTLTTYFFSFFILYWTIFNDLKKNNHFALFSVSFFALFLSSSIAGHGVGVINEGFFWLAGAAAYQAGAIFYYLFIACFLWMTRGRYLFLNWTLTSLLLFLCIGSNETLMLLSL